MCGSAMSPLVMFSVLPRCALHWLFLYRKLATEGCEVALLEGLD